MWEGRCNAPRDFAAAVQLELRQHVGDLVHSRIRSYHQVGAPSNVHLYAEDHSGAQFSGMRTLIRRIISADTVERGRLEFRRDKNDSPKLGSGKPKVHVEDRCHPRKCRRTAKLALRFYRIYHLEDHDWALLTWRDCLTLLLHELMVFEQNQGSARIVQGQLASTSLGKRIWYRFLDFSGSSGVGRTQFRHGGITFCINELLEHLLTIFQVLGGTERDMLSHNSSP